MLGQGRRARVEHSFSDDRKTLTASDTADNTRWDCAHRVLLPSIFIEGSKNEEADDSG